MYSNAILRYYNQVYYTYYNRYQCVLILQLSAYRNRSAGSSRVGLHAGPKLLLLSCIPFWGSQLWWYGLHSIFWDFYAQFHHSLVQNSVISFLVRKIDWE